MAKKAVKKTSTSSEDAALKKATRKKTVKKSTKATAKKTVKKSAPASKKPAKKKSAPAKRKRSTKKGPREKVVSRRGVEREILYPEVKVMLCLGDEAITGEDARKMMGWMEEGDVKFKSDYLVKDLTGKKIVCTNNLDNRPLYYNQVVLRLKQDILMRRWSYNGEPIIIGVTGKVLNGQHTLVALILAIQEWEKHPGRWKEYWETEPTIEKMVVLGIQETDEVVNTMDTARERSLLDVLYRSDFFADIASPREKKEVAKHLTFATRFLFERTGASDDLLSPIPTLPECIDFVHRHETILRAVGEIRGMINGESISRYIKPGTAAGLLYLFASSAVEDGDEEEPYSQQTRPDESSVDFSNWDLAVDFWEKLAKSDKKMNAISEVLTEMFNEYGSQASFKERVALLIKAWDLFSRKKKLTADAIRLRYEEDDDQVSHLLDKPLAGGIDIGFRQDRRGEVQPVDEE